MKHWTWIANFFPNPVNERWMESMTLQFLACGVHVARYDTARGSLLVTWQKTLEAVN